MKTSTQHDRVWNALGLAWLLGISVLTLSTPSSAHTPDVPASIKSINFDKIADPNIHGLFYTTKWTLDVPSLGTLELRQLEYYELNFFTFLSHFLTPERMDLSMAFRATNHDGTVYEGQLGLYESDSNPALKVSSHWGYLEITDKYGQTAFSLQQLFTGRAPVMETVTQFFTIHPFDQP